MVRRGQHRVFSPVGCRLRVAIIPARAAFAAPGPLGARHARYKVRICRNGRAGRFGVYGEGSRRERVIYGGELSLRTFSALLWSSDCFAALVPERVWRPTLRKRRRTGPSGRLPGWR